MLETQRALSDGLQAVELGGGEEPRLPAAASWMRDLIRCQNGMARKALGHDVRLIRTQYVKPFPHGSQE